MWGDRFKYGRPVIEVRYIYGIRYLLPSIEQNIHPSHSVYPNGTSPKKLENTKKRSSWGDTSGEVPDFLYFKKLVHGCPINLTCFSQIVQCETMVNTINAPLWENTRFFV
jgi:hypothetical protein